MAGCEQPLLLVEGKDALAPALVGRADKRVAGAEGVALDPALLHGDVEHAAQERHLAVDAGDRALAAASPGGRAEPERAEGAQVAVSESAQELLAEVLDEHSELPLDGRERAQAGHLPLVDVLRGHGVVPRVVGGQVGEGEAVGVEGLSGLLLGESYERAPDFTGGRVAGGSPLQLVRAAVRVGVAHARVPPLDELHLAVATGDLFGAFED